MFNPSIARVPSNTQPSGVGMALVPPASSEKKSMPRPEAAIVPGHPQCLAGRVNAPPSKQGHGCPMSLPTPQAGLSRGGVPLSHDGNGIAMTPSGFK